MLDMDLRLLMPSIVTQENTTNGAQMWAFYIDYWSHRHIITPARFSFSRVLVRCEQEMQDRYIANMTRRSLTPYDRNFPIELTFCAEATNASDVV